MISHDLIVIGAGPGGYVAAIRAAQLGMNAACVELEPQLGGTCLRIGCMPSKALLESSQRYYELKQGLHADGISYGDVSFDLEALMRRKDGIVNGLAKGIDALFKKNKVTRYQGRARFAGPGRVVVEGIDNVELAARYSIIATGSRPACLKGVELDGDRIATSTEALAYPEVPEHLVVIGAGYIGLELGSVWRRLGAKVTVVEYMDRILPGLDSDIARDAHKIFTRQGLEFRLDCNVLGARVEEGRCVVEIEHSAPLHADRVLMAVGRAPHIDNLGLETVNVLTDKHGRITVDAHFATSEDGIYAIGDVIPGPMLAHKAEEEGVACVEYLATGYGHVNYDAIPGVVYTHPEIATVGKSEDDLKSSEIAYRKGVFHFRGNGRARTIDEIDGRVKVLADAGDDRILGVHVIGPHAGDLIAEAAAAISFGASSEDLARISHAHPTVSEALKEAALAVSGRQVHA